MGNLCHSAAGPQPDASVSSSQPIRSDVFIMTSVANDTTATTTATSSLKLALNTCKSPAYTKVSDLREEVAYRVSSFEKVSTRYGETVTATVEGLVGDDYFLRVYLPRRFSNVLTDKMIEQYNTGAGERLNLVRRASSVGCTNTPLEFV